jgi:hypothetical protein
MSQSVQNWSYGCRLKPGPKAVLNALAWRADRNSWRAHPGIKQLALDTGFDARSVQRHLDSLESDGLVRRHRQHASDGHRKVDEFELNPTRSQPDNLTDNQTDSLSDSLPDNLAGGDARPTGQFDVDYRTNLTCLPDKLSSVYRRTQYEPSKRTKNKRAHKTDLLGDSAPEKSKGARRKKPLTAMPDLWPTAEDLSWASDYWRGRRRDDLVPQVNEIGAGARDHHLKYGNRFADWSAAWRTWARNEIKPRSQRARPPQSATETVERFFRGDDQ